MPPSAARWRRPRSLLLLVLLSLSLTSCIGTPDAAQQPQALPMAGEQQPRVASVFLQATVQCPVSTVPLEPSQALFLRLRYTKPY